MLQIFSSKILYKTNKSFGLL